MTLGQLYTAVEKTVEDNYPDRVNMTLVRLWVQNACREADAALKFSRTIALIALTDGVAQYAVHSSLRDIVYVTFQGLSDDKQKRLEFVEYSEWLAKDWEEGEPTHWSKWDNGLYLYPTPDTTNESVRIYACLPRMTDQTVAWSQETETNSSAIGTATYDLDVEFAQVSYVTYAGVPLTYEAFNTYLAETPASGTPTKWAIYANVLYLYPTPAVAADSIVAYGTAYPTEEVPGEADEPSIPAELHSIIFWKALASAYAHLQDVAAVRMYDSMAEEKIAEYLLYIDSYRAQHVRIVDVQPW